MLLYCSTDVIVDHHFHFHTSTNNIGLSPHLLYLYTVDQGIYSNILYKSKTYTMATLTPRQPFGILDESRLSNLTSLKNRQNGKSSTTSCPIPPSYNNTKCPQYRSSHYPLQLSKLSHHPRSARRKPTMPPTTPKTSILLSSPPSAASPRIRHHQNTSSLPTSTSRAHLCNLSNMLPQRPLRVGQFSLRARR